MKRVKRIASLLIVTAITLSTLAGCAAGRPDGINRVKDTFPEADAELLPVTGEEDAQDPPEALTETDAQSDPEEAVDPGENKTGTPDGGEFRVTAYITVGSLVDPEAFDASHLADVTDIILIGDARFDSAGTVSAGDSFEAAVRNIRDLTKELPVRIHATLSGPEAAADGKDREKRMNSMAAEHKKAFDSGVLEENILSFLRQYDLDGISFDYEYPLSETAKKQFGDFLVSLRQTLGGEYAIGMAVGGWCADFPADSIDAVDMVELMSYDLWDDDGMHSTLKIAQNDVRRLLELGYPAKKIDLGIPFYARPTTHERVWYAYNSFYDKIDGDGLYYEARTGLIHSFNTQKTVYDKTAWAVKQGLGGVMVWHYACDVPAENEYSLFNAIVQAKAEN